ncbi:MAG: hypothetical protein DGJ47_000917 [Rickettsiaceae bacterium]
MDYKVNLPEANKANAAYATVGTAATALSFKYGLINNIKNAVQGAVTPATQNGKHDKGLDVLFGLATTIIFSVGAYCVMHPSETKEYVGSFFTSKDDEDTIELSGIDADTTDI